MDKLESMNRSELLRLVKELTTIRIEDDDGELLEEIKYPESKFVIQTAVKSLFRRMKRSTP